MTALDETAPVDKAGAAFPVHSEPAIRPAPEQSDPSQLFALHWDYPLILEL